MYRNRTWQLALIIATATAATPATAAQVDRLFSTAAQRAHLDQLRHNNTPETASPPSQNLAPQPVKKLAPVSLEGIVRRSDGSEVIWINGKAVEQHQTADGIVVRQGPDQHHRVLIGTTDTRRYARLKPGQTWDRERRRVVENHQMQNGEQ